MKKLNKVYMRYERKEEVGPIWKISSFLFCDEKDTYLNMYQDFQIRKQTIITYALIYDTNDALLYVYQQL